MHSSYKARTHALPLLQLASSCTCIKPAPWLVRQGTKLSTSPLMVKQDPAPSAVMGSYSPYQNTLRSRCTSITAKACSCYSNTALRKLVLLAECASKCQPVSQQHMGQIKSYANAMQLLHLRKEPCVQPPPALCCYLAGCWRDSRMRKPPVRLW